MQSILGQSFEDFEFIIVDDGSTDRSREIVEAYAAKDSRIRLLSRANTGYAVALNEALGMVRGEFVARMDSDDVSIALRLSQQVRFLKEHLEVVAVGGQGVMIDPDGDPIGPLPCRAFEHESIDEHHLTGRGAMLIHPGMLIRREALERVGGYRSEFEPAEDLDLWLRLAEIGRLANLADVVIKYRVHFGSVSHTRSARQTFMSGRAAGEARIRRGLPPLNSTEFEVTHPSNADIVRSWVRNAYWNGCYRTARKHAMRAIRMEPCSMAS